MKRTRLARRIYRGLGSWIVLAALAGAVSSQTALRGALPESHDARMAWWREARFGMFIHWGLYAIPAGEWQGNRNHAEWIRHSAKIPIEVYDRFLSQFNPVRFNAAEWARLAREAGMKYLIITSKHHDGFCLWDSKLTDYDVMSTPFKRDILKELKAACDEEGIRLGFYYSIMDWHHPDYLPRRDWERSTRSAEGADLNRYIAYMKGQLRELITRYDPAVLWFDGEWEATWTHDMGIDLYDYVRGLKPDILINNRVDKGRQGMQGLTKEGDFRGDFGTPEQEIPARGLPNVDWESCMTMNRHWGWNKADTQWKSTEALLRNLIDIASKGGNFLLNIGPRADGSFPDQAIERLRGMGAWMEARGESIYGTSASPFGRLTWGRCTRKAGARGATLYLQVFHWPSDGQLLVPGLKNPVPVARLLNSGRELIARTTPEGLSIHVPQRAPNSIASTIAVEVPGKLNIEEVPLTQGKDGSLKLPAADAVLHGEQLQYESGANHDNIGFWLNPREWVEWPFQATRSGRYRVEADIACTADGSRFQLELDGQILQGTAPNTGDYGRFRSVNLGTIEIKSTGLHSMKVKPVIDRWSPINLRAIRIKPTGD